MIFPSYFYLTHTKVGPSPLLLPSTILSTSKLHAKCRHNSACELRDKIIKHCYTTLIDKLVLTWYAASLMNCLAFCLQIAGTVTTHLTSSLRMSDPVASLNSMRAWFRKYRKVMEKTVRAVKDLPLAARILVSSPISWKLFLRFLSRLLTIWLQQNNRQTLYLID